MKISPGKKRAESKKRLLELLGENAGAPPTSIEEARMLAEMEGVEIETRSGVRLDNECNKVCYSSESNAKAGAKHRLRNSANVGKLRQYFCDACKAWHLSSSFHR
jgi:hypothetical protein